MGENNEERKALIHKYYQTYRRLKERYNLRLYSHFDIYNNNFIEVWEYEGGREVRCICNVKAESETMCYMKAIEELKNYAETGRATNDRV